MDRVGLRELRQNVSRYVARAARGETIEVTDRGKPVARLVPSGASADLRDQLISEGLLVPAQRPLGAALALPRIASDPGTAPSEEILDAIREDRL